MYEYKRNVPVDNIFGQYICDRLYGDFQAKIWMSLNKYEVSSTVTGAQCI